MTIRDIMAKCEELAPPGYAEDWDNVGLLLGDPAHEVHTVVVALDATEAVIDKGVEEHADLILTHHPMLFRATKRLNTETLLGRKVWKMAGNEIAQYAMHTNFDVSHMASLVAQKIGLTVMEPLEVTVEESTAAGPCKKGIGAIGIYEPGICISGLGERIKDAFGLPHIFLYGDKQETVTRVAICPGSGRSEIDVAIEKGAQLLITGDIGHHEGIDAVDEKLMILDATHYGLEHIFIEYMTQTLRDWFRKMGAEIRVIPVDTGSPVVVL